MKRLALILTVCCASTSLAQTTIQGDNRTIRLGNTPDITRQTRVAAGSAEVVVVRALDKLSGASIDLELGNQKSVPFGSLSISMQECRFPKDNPSGDAYAHLKIVDNNLNMPVFDGWMVASSPALSALDHARYDVWVIRCKLDNRTPAVVAGESSPRPIMRPVALDDSSNG